MNSVLIAQVFHVLFGIPFMLLFKKYTETYMIFFGFTESLCLLMIAIVFYKDGIFKEWYDDLKEHIVFRFKKYKSSKIKYAPLYINDSDDRIKETAKRTLVGDTNEHT